MLVVIYLFLCLVIGIIGRRRRLGFLGYFILSLALTPFVMLLVLLVTQRRFLAQEAAVGAHAAACPHCNRLRRQLTGLSYCAHCGRPL